MKRGFTLIELLVVVLIIGILAAIALPQYTTAVEKSRAAEAISLMGSLRYAGERYRLQMGYFPSSLDVLDITVPASTKNFTISAAASAAGDQSANYVIKAVRTGGSVDYVLGTLVTPAGVATRSCGSEFSAAGDMTAPSGEALKICNAITSGSNDNF